MRALNPEELSKFAQNLTIWEIWGLYISLLVLSETIMGTKRKKQDTIIIKLRDSSAALDLQKYQRITIPADAEDNIQPLEFPNCKIKKDKSNLLDLDKYGKIGKSSSTQE